ncbi:histidinol-phosphate transaminase [Companilactobacillus halodurans]|uniref:Histidinol-phosphate aminotransferase n=2 Tax=Companilactobacillus halodurans TaxID=2584183 RepID=A0A5P0ZTW2_9LACO|nr:histidinol-phosphate transaminase [Companilactobacillus halodurans]MQS96493.1 histidinol-phosphate transaminase [Companilactobacillus halodurans]
MREVIKKLQPYVPEKPLEILKDELGLKKLVRLSANENPYGTSPKVKKAVIDWTYEQSNRYPDGNASELRQLIAKRFSLDPKQIVFSVGLDEMIAMLSRVFLEPGDEELISTPTFSEYALNAEIEEASIKKVPVLNNGGIDFSGMLEAVNSKTKLIWLCNPNNPTGTYETTADIEKFIQQVPNKLVLIDEAYIDFVDQEKPSTMELTKKYPNVVVMRTFSKVYGLANFRIGYSVFAKQIAEQMQKVRLPYNVNSIAQVAAKAAFEDQNFVDQVVQKNSEQRISLERFFNRLEIKYYQSQANFIFFKYPEAEKLANYLLQNGYLLRTELKKDWLRLTIGTKEDNQEIQKLIENYGRE